MGETRLFDAHTVPPTLLGGRCEACGYKFFPMQHYGCEVCGATSLVDQPLVAKGRVVSLAVVHIHPDPALPTPFTIGGIELDEGVSLRAIIETATERPAEVGDRVVAKAVAAPRAAIGDIDLRFETVKGGVA